MPWQLWAAAFLTFGAIALLNFGGQATRRPGRTVLLSLAAAATYALFDVLVQKWAPADRTSALFICRTRARVCPLMLLLRTLLTLSLLCAGAAAATLTVVPTADAFVTPGSSGGSSGLNYGKAGILGVAPAGAAQGEFQSVLRFDLSTVKAGFDGQFGAGNWTVQSITLQLTAAPANNGILNAPAAGQFLISWMQNDAWAEGTGTPSTPTTDGITFSSLPSLLGAADQAEGTFGFDGSTSGAKTYALALAPGLLGDVTAGGPASLRVAAADSTVSYLFNSRSITAQANVPVLSVQAVPEPGAGALLGLGAALGTRRRRRRAP